MNNYYSTTDVDTIVKTLKDINDVDTVTEQYEEFLRTFSTRPDPDKFPKYKEGSIIDPEESVNWNIAEVSRRIKAYDDEVKRLRGLHNMLGSAYERRIKELCSDEYNLSPAKADLIWYYAYEEGHHEGIRATVDVFRRAAELYSSLRDIE